MSLYNTNVDDIYRPSFFELIAADRLLISLKPAAKHVITLLNTSIGRYAPTINIHQYQDEIFYLLLFLLERHYLKEYNSTFAENFYGLTRLRLSLPSSFSYSSAHNAGLIYGAQATITPTTPSATPAPSSPTTVPAVHLHPLSASDRRRALFCCVLLPYIKGRLDTLYKQYTENNIIIDEQTLQQNRPALTADTFRSQVHKLFVLLYPYFHAVYEATLLFYQLRYLFELTSYYSPLLQLMQQTIRRMTQDDLTANSHKPSSSPATLTAASSPSSSSSSFDSIWSSSSSSTAPRGLKLLFSACSTFVNNVFSSLSSSAKYLIVFGLFAFKFMEWWYSPANTSMITLTHNAAAASSVTPIVPLSSLPTPPAPVAPPPAPTGVAVPSNSDLCPLCLRDRTNPAASSSGYVFCYPCLFAYVDQYHQCPVTLQRCSIPQIRKIYES